jgi:4-amino-4-deoxy-L-arabinose transferase-like glycosyltransferase
MTDRTTWLRTRVRAGWLLLALGIAVLAASVILARANPDFPWNLRIMGGVGIVIAGVGVGLVARYRPAISNDDVARRLIVEERDERGVLIRRRAGHRAYWMSALLVYSGLMWTSFASNGDLPALEGDGLWNYLVIALLVPFTVYVGSVLVDEHRT